MRTSALLALAMLGCSSPTEPASDASIDYYSGDGAVYAYNDAAPACQPAATTGFSPVKITPLALHACTDAQIQGVVSQCFDPSLPDNTACKTWRADPANQACLDSCIVTSIDAGAWGPLVKVTNPGVLEFYDLGACVATFDPSPAGQACADALNAEFQCEQFACAGNCPIPADAGAADLVPAEIAFQNCTLAAGSGPCASYLKAVTDCVGTIPASSPQKLCVDGTLLSGDPTSYDPAAEKFFGAQCGGADAGASDAGLD